MVLTRSVNVWNGAKGCHPNLCLYHLDIWWHRGATRLYPGIYIVPPPSLTHALSPTNQARFTFEEKLVNLTNWARWSYSWQDQGGLAWQSIFHAQKCSYLPFFQSLIEEETVECGIPKHSHVSLQFLKVWHIGQDRAQWSRKWVDRAK